MSAAVALGGLREHRVSVLVAALGSSFGVVLLNGTAVLSALVAGSSLAVHSTVGLALVLVAMVFIVIAVYVASIVISNTFATIVAGRTRTIALMRLIGSTAHRERSRVAREGLAVGVTGTVLGALIGEAITLIGVGWLRAAGALPEGRYPLVSGWIVLPIVAVVLSTWLASWAGSRRVLSVSPIEATGASVEPSLTEQRANTSSTVFSLILMVVGFAVIGLGILVGLLSPAGVLVSLVGGVLSFTGLVLGAHLVMPPMLRLVGRLLGRSTASRLAAANAVRYPLRSSRTTIGVVIGVTLITMFAVAASTYRSMIFSASNSSTDAYAGADRMVGITVGVFTVMIGFSGVIAAVGLINNLSLSVLQRTRELGLLRAIGLSAVQVRFMVLAEAVTMTVSAVVVGVLLGILYGWAGAQSLLGGVEGSPGLVAPTVPWAVILAVVAFAAVLALLASIAPSRRATTVSPMTALTVD